MRAIPLHNSELIALVDDEDFERVIQFKWYVVQHQGTWYAVTTFGEKRSPFYMHRFVLSLKSTDPGVDHADRNGLNNQKSNLRTANNSQQQGNRPKISGTYSSKYKGVSWSKARQCWYATIQMNGKSKYLGSSKIEEEAAKFYDDAAIKHYGEFAHLNFERG